MISEGTPCPFFETQDEAGNTVNTNLLKGGNFILYFYPKDDTPGCTIEANDFNNLKKQFEALDCKIFGISKCSAKSHIKFKQKYCLNFPLLLDESAEICNLFDTIKEKSMFGKKYLGISRDTFLINKEGIVVKIWRSVSATKHATEVLKYLTSL